ncbi:tRNA dihydrouridine synthase DusB [uncultured Anaerococcus sp.]|uniref:tRNA dihydrouridine synthase DusB n=1 Tax=uncultured Anaerococcus sp. TaxID=293428 RepID=UPI00261C2920|nr:tRNA dihydrouridine synthase DusB [uncultured Anaerococcus sp.]
MRETKTYKPIMLAPLAGVTDAAFRIICEENGADKTFTEMVSVNALVYDNRATKEIMFKSDLEKNCNIQIFGSDPAIIEKVVKEKINPREDFKEISFNMGCPAPKIFKNGQGSALLADTKKVYKIAKTLVASTDKLVNVKFRLGIDENSINYIEVGKALQDAGVAYVILHARTKAQQYSGKANWEDIRKLKETLTIPVIANGDIFSFEDYKEVMEITKADGAMIARGAMGNPFIFRQIKDYLNAREIFKPSYEDILNTIKRQYDLSLTYKEERLVINQMRKHVGWYIKGLPQSSLYRDRVNKLKTSKEIFDLLDEYRQYLEDNYDRK